MFDVGIAEQHAATLCGALAGEGLKPVYAVYSTFLQRAYDQVVHDICRQNLNVIFAIDRAGFVGADGETHQGVYDIAFLRHIPNMVLMMPKDENELRHMLKTAVDYNEGPIAVRYPRLKGRGVALDTELTPIPLGTWEVLRDGERTAILAVGPMIDIALEAAEQLAKEGSNVRVINARFIKPLDENMLLRLAQENMNIITLEEGVQSGGFGSAVMEFFSNRNIFGVPIKIMGIADYFVEHGSVDEQRQETGLTSEHVVNALKVMMPRKRQRA